SSQGALGQRRRQVAKERTHGRYVDLVALGKNVGACDRILEFTNVAGPVVLLEPGSRFRREHFLAFFALVQFFEKLLSQVSDVGLAFAQGRHLYWKHGDRK